SSNSRHVFGQIGGDCAARRVVRRAHPSLHSDLASGGACALACATGAPTPTAPPSASGVATSGIGTDDRGLRVSRLLRQRSHGLLYDGAAARGNGTGALDRLPPRAGTAMSAAVRDQGVG